MAEIIDNIVYGCMGTGSRGEDIVARIHNIGALAVQSGGIPACKISGGNGYGHILAFACGNLYLCGVEEVYGRFFNLVLYIVFSVRPADIELGEEVAVLVALVGHPYCGCNVARLRIIDLYGGYLLRVGDVGKALAEGEYNLVCVVPCLACLGRTYGSRGVGALGVYYRVEITGLVILVADIDAFCLNYVVIGEIVCRIPAERIVEGCYGIKIGILLLAHVDRRGREAVVVYICIGEAAGGVHFAGKHVGNALILIVVGYAAEAYGVDLVPAALFNEVAELHCIRRNDEHNYLCALLFSQLNESEFVGRECKRIFGIGSRVHLIVVAFAAAASENYDAGSGVFIYGPAVRYRIAGSNLGNDIFISFPRSCRTAAPAAAARRACHGARELVGRYGVVYCDAADTVERVLKSDLGVPVGALSLAASGPAVARNYAGVSAGHIVCVPAEERHVAARRRLVQGKRIVIVLQERKALFALPYGVRTKSLCIRIDSIMIHLMRSTGKIYPSGFALDNGVFNLLYPIMIDRTVVYSEESVDPADGQIGLCNSVGHRREGEERSCRCGYAAKQLLMLLEFHLVFSLLLRKFFYNPQLLFALRNYRFCQNV